MYHNFSSKNIVLPNAPLTQQQETSEVYFKEKEGPQQDNIVITNHTKENFLKKICS